MFIAKIFVYKHWFCYFTAEDVKQRDSLFYQPTVLWLAIGDVSDNFAVHAIDSKLNDGGERSLNISNFSSTQVAQRLIKKIQ